MQIKREKRKTTEFESKNDVDKEEIDCQSWE